MSTLSPRAVYVASVAILAKDLDKALVQHGTSCLVTLQHEEVAYSLLPQEYSTEWKAGCSPVYTDQSHALRFVVGDGDVAAVSDAQLLVELRSMRTVTSKSGILSCISRSSEVEEVCCSAMVRLQDVMMTAGMTQTYTFEVRSGGKLEVEIALSKPVPGRHLVSLQPDISADWIDQNEEALYRMQLKASTQGQHRQPEDRESPVRKRARQASKDVLGNVDIKVVSTGPSDELGALNGDSNTEGDTSACCTTSAPGVFDICNGCGEPWGQLKVKKWSNHGDADVLATSCEVELATGHFLTVTAVPAQEAKSYGPSALPVRVDAVYADSPSSTSSAHNKIFPDVPVEGGGRPVGILRQWKVAGSLRSSEDLGSFTGPTRMYSRTISPEILQRVMAGPNVALIATRCFKHAKGSQDDTMKCGCELALDVAADAAGLGGPLVCLAQLLHLLSCAKARAALNEA